MPKSKKDINQNFEMLKAQMQAKRKRAESSSLQETNEEVVNDKVIVKQIDNADDTTPQVKATPTIHEDAKPNLKDSKIKLEIEKESPILEGVSEIAEKKKRGPKPKIKQVVTEDLDEDFDEDLDEDLSSFESSADVSAVSSSADGTIKIKIKKQEKPEAPRRATYYLKQETIRQIEKVSKITGIGKSKLVQTLLDQALENLEIEK